ncbi:hypothetical protein MHU86_22876 [Fragilaria crotonensis]|nr:hypothetical protein MHU86_22876 [Fragilaria crotonensis]
MTALQPAETPMSSAGRIESMIERERTKEDEVHYLERNENGRASTSILFDSDLMTTKTSSYCERKATAEELNRGVAHRTNNHRECRRNGRGTAKAEDNTIGKRIENLELRVQL